VCATHDGADGHASNPFASGAPGNPGPASATRVHVDCTPRGAPLSTTCKSVVRSASTDPPRLSVYLVAAAAASLYCPVHTALGQVTSVFASHVALGLVTSPGCLLTICTNTGVTGAVNPPFGAGDN